MKTTVTCRGRTQDGANDVRGRLIGQPTLHAASANSTRDVASSKYLAPSVSWAAICGEFRVLTGLPGSSARDDAPRPTWSSAASGLRYAGTSGAFPSSANVRGI